MNFEMLVEKNNNTSGSPAGTTTPINDCKMQISAYSMQGRRGHMEDYFDIGYLMKPVEMQKPNEWPYEYFYFGVFDGHGGSHAASFAKANLLKLITKQQEFWSDDDEDVLEAIKKGFAETHEAMLKDMPNWTRTSRILPSTAGTTASIIFIRNGKFYTGHVGDSRIVISKEHPETKNWCHDELTQDHKPENEVERIENAGGQVKTKIGVHRVVWRRPVLCKWLEEKLTAEPKHPCYEFCMDSVSSYPIDKSLVECYQTIPFLAIARSLGDFWSFNPDNGEYIVSPEPDVMCRPITKNDKCILLATDGLWNVINSSQATRFLQELKIIKDGERDSKVYSDTYFATDNFYDVTDPKDESNHALSLVYMAYQIWERRHMRSDNITAVVALLSDIVTPQQEIGQGNETQKRSYTEAYIADHGFQLGQTRIVHENVLLNDKPKFQLASDDSEVSKILESLKDYLLWNPRMIQMMKHKAHRSYVKPPRNFYRLEEAECRKLEREFDDFILMKEASDDPGDSIRCPARKNSKNVEVRDSSAQATQPMYDFGELWWGEIDFSEFDGPEPGHEECCKESQTNATEPPARNLRSRSASKQDKDLTEKVEDGDKEVEKVLVAVEKPAVKVEEAITDLTESSDDVEVPDFTDGNLSDNIILDGAFWYGPRSSDQVLSVRLENRPVNKIAHNTRPRSATENPKRKPDIEMSTCPKTKRRKSHPIHSVAAVTKS